MTVYERLAATDDGQRRLSRARLRYRILGALSTALDQSDVNRTQLAERLGLRKSAVSQVLCGDGNLRVNTIADYLSALGQELEIQVVPLGTSRAKAVGTLPRLDLVWSQAQAMPSIVEGGRVRHDSVRPWHGDLTSTANG